MTINRLHRKSAFLKKYAMRPEFSVLVMFLLMLAISSNLQSNFFEQKSMVRNMNAFMPLILMSMGQAVVMISGGIDLSIGSALSLLTCVLTYVMKKDDPLSGIYALLVAFAIAMVIGIVNGIGTGYLRIPPVIVTFATSYIWLGLALFIRPTPGGESVPWYKWFYDINAFAPAPAWAKKIGTLLPPAFWLILVGCLIWYLVSRMKTGRYLYAVGSNSDSAYESGINTARIQMYAYMISSLFVLLTALFFVGQNQSGDARMGDPLTLRTIAAAVVGGIAMSGGRGNIYFVIVGALILSLVNKIIFFADIPYAYQTLVGGFIVILAIASSKIYTMYNRKGTARLKGK
ncbi:MAG: ABC transporter permease [Chlorobium sp.]|nr:ABC transporter permease [Chlorobium sp.]